MKKRVYDIVNAGPRHRFTVRSKQTHDPMVVSNCIQMLSRDIFGWQMAQLYNEGIPALFDVHDEDITEAKIAELERVEARMDYWMTQAPSWMKGLPLTVSGGQYSKYEKD